MTDKTPGDIADAVFQRHVDLGPGHLVDLIEKAIAVERKRAAALVVEARQDYHAVCEALGMMDYAEGQGPVYASAAETCRVIKEMQREHNTATDERIPKTRASWHEDDGAVVWWKFPITEPPYVGSPLDDDFPDYVTHWTRVQLPFEAYDDA